MHRKYGTINSMKAYAARVSAMALDERNKLAARLETDEVINLAPGQYFLVDDGAGICAQTIFCTHLEGTSLLALPPLPGMWQPGLSLRLLGPMGSGFALPAPLRRLALAVIEGSPAYLLGLARHANQQGAEVALFAESPLPPLPAWLEASPLTALPEALAWADFLALDLTAQALPRLRHWLGLPSPDGCPCPAQALVRLPMPCGAVAECGACAVTVRRGWRLVCKDGPVLNLNDLEW
jgi:dihydroorotate dehydrogenase electron transfer subunit